MTGRARAFYAREGSTVNDVLTILHIPYTAWHLSYVVIGAAVAPQIDWIRFGGTLVAFFGGTGLSAHALDEWNGRPLQTRLSDRALFALVVVGLLLVLGAVTVGIRLYTPWVIAWAVVGALLVLGYSLEWFGGVLHTDLGFALLWGGFPVVASYWVQTASMSGGAIGLAVVAVILSLVQRSLSTSARFVRRRTRDARTRFTLDDGEEEWSQHELLETWERPLSLLSVAMVLLALSLLLFHTW
jgi:hypothetical protein